MLKNIKYYAFTIAETMIVLIIMGTLFTLIIPSTMSKHRESINRVKIKKSMAYYEVVFKKLVVDNAIMTDSSFKKKVQTSNCDKIKKQFKIIETDGDCVFRAAEDVWWNVTDFTEPFVVIKKDNLNKNKANATDNNVCFRFSGHIVNGVLRINDMGYLPNGEEKTAVQKVYNYINNKN